MHKKVNSGKTTADVFFRSNERKPERNCEAWIDKDGNILCLLFDSMEYKPSELAELGVAAVDIQQTLTYYF